MKKFVTDSGRTLVRLSRWIKVRHNYNPNRRNSLWDYVTDGSGNGPHSERFDPKKGLYLDFFRWNGRNWAIDQFLSTTGIMGFHDQMIFKDETGKDSFISGYDSENYFSPILLEVDDCGEYVRVYEEVSE